VLEELNRQLADRKLLFGPKPSTHTHCALGGMIGNNSCGACGCVWCVASGHRRHESLGTVLTVAGLS
jgi:FAD/FMN-containing dehydrogenase